MTLFSCSGICQNSEATARASEFWRIRLRFGDYPHGTGGRHAERACYITHPTILPDRQIRFVFSRYGRLSALLGPPGRGACYTSMRGESPR